MKKHNFFSEPMRTNTDAKIEGKNPKDITAWSYDSKVTLKSVLNAIANWRTRRLTNFKRFPHFVWTIDHLVKTKDLEIVREWSET